MANYRNHGKKPGSGVIAAIVIALVVLAPELLAVVAVIAVPVAIFGSTFYMAYLAKKKSGSSGAQQPMPKQEQSFPVDECPKPICFHKDKGEHHVKRGKELDPWDRPDIDISKYQRRE